MAFIKLEAVAASALAERAGGFEAAAGSYAAISDTALAIEIKVNFNNCMRNFTLCIIRAGEQMSVDEHRSCGKILSGCFDIR